MLTTGLGLAELKNGYFFIVDRVIAGPQSWSYFVPFLLLPAALMMPPNKVSQKQLIQYFLLPIYACAGHAWYVMGCWDVVSLDGVLWATYLLALDDPRTHYRRVRFVPNRPMATPPQQVVAKTIPAMMHLEDNTVPENRTTASATNGHGSKADGPKPSATSRPRLQTATSYYIDDEAWPPPIYERLRWVLNLVSSDRLARWKTGNARHDAKQYNRTPTRRKFCLDLVPQLVTASLFISGATMLSRHDPYFKAPHLSSMTSSYTPPISAPKTVQLIYSLLPAFAVRPLAIGFFGWALVTIEFALLAPPAVFLNYLTGLPPDNWSPHTLPPYFGSFTDGALDNGVRGLWGTFWHAHLQNMILAPGKVLARAIGVDKKNEQGKQHWLGYALPMTSAFIFSGVIHMGMVPRNPAFQVSNVGPWSLRWRIASVFWFQPVGVAIEMAMGKAIKSVVPKQYKNEKGQINEENVVIRTLFRTVRLGWVLTWLCCSAPFIALPFADLAFWNIPTPWFLPDAVKYWTGGYWLP